MTTAPLIMQDAPLLDEETIDLTIQKMFPEADPYLGDPVGFAEGKLRLFLTEEQKELLRSIVEHRYTAAPAAHDLGKTFLMAVAAIYWIAVHPPGTAFVVSTAPTWKQVKAILWRELRRLHKLARLAGRINLDCEWYNEDDELVAYGRKPADTDQAAFQGIHALYVLVIIDEGCGVPKSLFEAADSLATNENARVVSVGNPDDPTSHFETICRPGSGWNVIPMDGLRSPNFTRENLKDFPDIRQIMEEEGIPFSTEPFPDRLRPLLLSPLWVQERIDRWGVGSHIFAAKVRGRFSHVTQDTLISPALIREAQVRDLPGIGTGRYALDVARFGRDRTVLYRNRDGVIRRVFERVSMKTTETAGAVVAHMRAEHHPMNQPTIVIDGVGVGGGVVDILSEQSFPVVEFSGGSAAYDSEQFVDRRSEMYWMLRELMEAGEIDLDPEDDDLAAQLGGIKYFYTSKGKIRVESKEDMAKRLRGSADIEAASLSPDHADAVTMSLVEEAALTEYERDKASPKMLTSGIMKRAL